jgi:hypothetical protein
MVDFGLFALLMLLVSLMRRLGIWRYHVFTVWLSDLGSPSLVDGTLSVLTRVYCRMGCGTRGKGAEGLQGYGFLGYINSTQTDKAQENGHCRRFALCYVRDSSCEVAEALFCFVTCPLSFSEWGAVLHSVLHPRQ